MGEVRRRAAEVRGEALGRLARDRGDAEGLEHGIEGRGRRGLPDADADVVRVDETQVHAALAGRRDDLGGPAGDARQDGVEERLVHDLDATLREGGGQGAGLAR